MAGPVRYHLGKFPPDDLEWKRLIPLIGPANAGLARYDGLLSAIPNSQVLLSPLTTQEAVLSSKIEGTNVTIGEVLEIEAGGESEAFTQPKRDDAEEVLNYRKAMVTAVKELRQRPISQHLIRSIHAQLMQGVRGKNKSPGQIRTDQNWIGSPGCPIDEASFVPIAPEHLPQGLDDWERFVATDPDLDVLVHLALIHVEFEALHPFQDGNGRLGRMLIPLYLYHRGLLSSPEFYMSGYLETNRDLYLERLRSVSRHGDWTSWCEFFLRGIQEQASENERKARAILDLYEQVKLKVVDTTHSQHSIRAVDFLFQTPIFSGSAFTGRSDIPKPTANRILRILRDEGLLLPIREGRGRSPGVYAFRELLNIAEDDEVF